MNLQGSQGFQGAKSGSSGWARFEDERSAANRVTALLLYIPLVATTILTKIAVAPLSPDISVAVPCIILTPLIGVILGRVRIDPVRATLFLVVMSLLWFMQVFSGNSFSLPSMLLLTALFSTMTVYLDLPACHWRRAMRVFLDLSLFLAAAGILQFVLQFVVDIRYAFPIEHFLPQRLLIQHFHYLNPLRYGGSTYKSNGVFLLEPSQFSQLLAVALIGELVTLSRKWRCLLYVLGMVVAYSGTGMIILAICLPLLIGRLRRWDILALMTMVAMLLLVLSNVLQLDIFVHRLGEVGSERSSGFARFVGGFYAFADWLWPDTARALFGYGAGSFGEASRQFVVPAAEMPLNKIVFEFGIVGSLALFGFLLACLIRSHGPGLFRTAVGLSFFLNGLYVPTAQGIALTVMIWSGAILAAPAAARLSASARVHHGTAAEAGHA